MITSEPLFPGVLLAQFTAANSQSGAVVSFSGNVRVDKDNGRTCALILEAYEPVTSNGIAEAIKTAQSRWTLSDVMVRHRIGRMNPSCLLYTSPSPRDKRQSRMPSSA